MDRHCDSGRSGGRVVVGLALMAFGGGLLLQRLGLLPDDLFRFFPPLLLIGLGVARMVRPRGQRGGFWMLVVGVLLGLHVAGLAYLHDTWPTFVIAAGAGMVWRAFEPRRQEPPA